tara:strand:+ start:1386 stop:1691 length:306 start_codon:yes stop_codon:yes gene_type:complete
MANIFFHGEKAPKQEAINSLTIKISEYYGGRYEVRASSDDGGSHLEVQVEKRDPSSSLLEESPHFPMDEIWPKWAGWRVVVLLVPVGYIDAITNHLDSDDY